MEKEKIRLEIEEMKLKVEETRHKNRMEELAVERENQKKFYEQQMAYHRLKRRDIDRELARKEALKYS